MAAGTTTFPTTLDSNVVRDNTDEITSTDHNDHSVQIEAVENYLLVTTKPIIQVVMDEFKTYAGTGGTPNTCPFDNTIPQLTEGTEFMEAVITPTSATNELWIEAVAYMTAPVGHLCMHIHRGSTADADAVGVEYFEATDRIRRVSVAYKMLAGTTSATTFNVVIGSDGAGEVAINGTASSRIYGGVLASYIRITEQRPTA